MALVPGELCSCDRRDGSLDPRAADGRIGGRSPRREPRSASGGRYGRGALLPLRPGHGAIVDTEMNDEEREPEPVSQPCPCCGSHDSSVTLLRATGDFFLSPFGTRT